MILAEQYLRCHIARRATCIARVERLPHSCISEIYDFQVAILLKDKVRWTNIPVHHTVRMHELKRLQDARYDELGLSLVKSLLLIMHPVGEVTSRIVLRD